MLKKEIKLMYLKVLFALTLFALFTGCATPKHNYCPIVLNISDPPIKSINTAYVGDVLLKQGTFTEQDSIYVQEPQKVYWAYTILPGVYLKQGEDKNTEFYKPESGPEGGGINKSALADPWKCVQAFKKEKKLCVITVFNAQVCNSGANYIRQKRPMLRVNDFQQTLIYSGKIGNKINIGYREFSGNMARPAFNNDVEYDLGESNIIGYKGARLEIIKATNELIQYRVIRNFNAVQF